MLNYLCEPQLTAQRRKAAGMDLDFFCSRALKSSTRFLMICSAAAAKALAGVSASLSAALGSSLSPLGAVTEMRESAVGGLGSCVCAC